MTIAEFFAGVDTLPELLARRSELTPSEAAYVTQQASAAWSSTTWSEFRDDVAALSSEFSRRGVAAGTRFGILAVTSLGWEAAQMAALACGATVAGIDPYYPNGLIDELVVQLGLTCLIVDDAAMLERLSARTRDRLTLVVFIRDDIAPSSCSIPTLSRLRAQARPASSWTSSAKAEAPAIIAFSSGSAGSPKAILYTHAQVVHACRCILELYAELSPGTRLVCWLPLANLFQRMINFCATAKGAVSYIVEDPRRVMEVVPIAKPEVLVAVPRFCEKVYAAMMQRIHARPFLPDIVERAFAMVTRLRKAEEGSMLISLPERLAARLVDRLLLARLRNAMGGRLRFIISGSAPMPSWLLDWFFALGIPVLEAYGASENIVPIAANRISQRKSGTVGKPVGDNEVRIAADGEVQVRGRGVFLPALAENAHHAGCLTDDGYLATGDLGFFDDEGFLTLYGRRNEAFKTSQGRWVSLVQIEAVLRRLPEVEHAAVLRGAHDRLIAVLALGQVPDTLRRREPTSAAEAEQRLGAGLRANLARELATLPAAMRPIAFLVVCAGFSPATGFVTTNLKLRRAVIADNFGDLLGALVDEGNISGRRTNEELTLKFV